VDACSGFSNEKRLRLSCEVDACCGFRDQKRLRFSRGVDERNPLPHTLKRALDVVLALRLDVDVALQVILYDGGLDGHRVVAQIEIVKAKSESVSSYCSFKR
jgi:hypothetical protein